MLKRLRLAPLIALLAIAGCSATPAPSPVGHCHARGLLPDPACTPGATNPAVTQATISRTICTPGWTRTIRPPVAYTAPLKLQQIRAYGYTDTSPASYEEDHLVALELGGAPRDPRNLWPEARPGSSRKDAIENLLRERVCAGQLPLAAAQREIATDWTGVQHATSHVAATRHAATTPQPSCPGYVTPYGCQAHSPTFGLPPAGSQPSFSPRVPTIEMRDTVTPSAIPASTAAVAGYTSGLFITYPPLVARFPRAFHVSIAVNASHTIDNFGRPIRCLDVEPGDAVPSQAGPWDRQIIRDGGRPCDYENRSELPAVQASIRASGLRPGVDVDEWVADWTFRPHLYPGSACTQWTDHGPHGENYDESTCTRAFFGAAPAPKPKPAPASGTASFAGTFGVTTGRWTVRGTPGKVTFGQSGKWASAEIQVCTGGSCKGQWRLAPLPFDARPLGK